MASKPSAAASQSIVDIETIRDGVVVLKSGALRAVLMASSLNFELKSEVEQDAIIAAYQDFLNALDFPIQYLIHSRRLDIEGYLERVREYAKQGTNELLRAQTEEYTTFIKGFVEVANIMQKFFYIVIPFAPSSERGAGLVKSLTALFTRGKGALAPERFSEHKAQLWQRVELVSSGLRRLGIRTVPLKDDELLNLFMEFYRPSAEETITTAQLEALGIQTLQGEKETTAQVNQ